MFQIEGKYKDAEGFALIWVYPEDGHISDICPLRDDDINDLQATVEHLRKLNPAWEYRIVECTREVAIQTEPNDA